MILLLVIASAFLQVATSNQTAHLNDTFYAVMVSSELKGGMPEVLCAHINGASVKLTFTITLVTESVNITILEEEPVAKGEDYYSCLTFEVPNVTSFEVATIHALVKDATFDQDEGPDDQEQMTKMTKVLIRPPAFVNFIVTDKPIYKPGQTVWCRIVSLDDKFLPINRKYKIVELQDTNGNRIAQWRDKTADTGILDLSHYIIPEAAQGIYVITAWTDEDEIELSYRFEVKEYVLPKFEVTVHLPSVISILDEEVTMKICGKYTYGKPVHGSVKVELCRKVHYYWYRSDREKQSDICKTYEPEPVNAECVEQVVKVAEFAPYNGGYQDEFIAEAELQETATGVTLKGTGSARFTAEIRSVTFEDAPTTYHSGITFSGKVKMVLPDSTPAVNEPVYVFAYSQGRPQNVTVITDNKGMASFSMDTTLWKGIVSLQAQCTKEEGHIPYDSMRKPRYRSAHMSVTEFYSKSNSFVKIAPASEPFHCSESMGVHADFIIPATELNEGQTDVDFFYLVSSRGRLVEHGKVTHHVKAEAEVKNGSVCLHFYNTAEMTPYAQVLVYALLPSGEAIADSMDFPIDLCLKNEMSLQFLSAEALPGENVNLFLKAAPHSLCTVRAVDQSVLLLKSENELSLEYVFSLLPVDKLTGYDYQLNDNEPHFCLPTLYHQGPPSALDLEESKRRKRAIFFPGYNEKNDVYGVFKAIGFKILTNWDVKKPYSCDHYFGGAQPGPPAVAMAFETRVGSVPASSGGSKETIRSHFPETWILDLVVVGADGALFLEKTVPDTITEWAAGAFCTSPTEGLGLALNAALTAFQPFFVSLTLPYSVIRGESFTLKATVFNYLSQCIMVKATLSESDQYDISECDDDTVMQCVYKVCLCKEQSHTFNWIVTPKVLGEVSLEVSAEALDREVCGHTFAFVPEKRRKDTVIRRLLVEAEGVPQSITHNAFLRPTEGAGGALEETISLDLPDNITPGSAKACVSVLGDLMGRAMQNLDKLLTMPYGCGEQNMVKFAPNIYILRYLQSTHQITPKILDKAIRFMESGYQRQLNYKHDDGSYSAFGKSDKSGNTWLTAFVMKSFAGAAADQFIFVDPKHIGGAKKWLASHQNKTTGCIQSVGKLLNNGMKGGVSDDTSLTAYITAAILEADPNNTTDTGIDGYLTCLQQAVHLGEHRKNNYTAALLAYTFTLAANQDLGLEDITQENMIEIRRTLLNYLEEVAIVEDTGTKHWGRDDGPDNTLDSLAVEMTSYALLAMLSGPPISLSDSGETEAEFDTASIARWLAQQQNPQGGFASTQDTVVALQALALFANTTYVPEFSVTVTVTMTVPPELVARFEVNETNRLLLQEQELKTIPWDYTIRAEGQGYVLAQIALHYNIPPPEDFSSFKISACVISNCTTTKPQVMVTVGVTYQGRRDETNMVIIYVKMLSGYVVNTTQITEMKNNKQLVQRVDVEEGYINIYVEGLKKDVLKTFKVVMEEEEKVRNLKPAVVKVYDYYQPSDEASTDYITSCVESDTVNEVD